MSWQCVVLILSRLHQLNSQWIEIATESSGNSGTDKFRYLDFNNEIYNNYPVSTIDRYRIEWDWNTVSFDNIIIFALSASNPTYEIFKDAVPNNQNEDINIDIISSTISSSIPVANNQLFCKACATASSSKYGDTCWAILPSTDSNRGCGCSSSSWTGTGIYYGGQTSNCNQPGCSCWGGAFAGYRSDGQAKGGRSSVGLRISILLKTNNVPEIIWSDPMDPPKDTSQWQLNGSPSITQKETDSYCVENDNTANCWKVCATNSDPNSGYIFKIAPTIGYQNISLKFNIDPWAMQNTGDKCSIWYSIDNQDANWMKFHESDSSHHIIEEIFNFPPTTSNNIGVGIKVLALDGNSNCCYISDFSLRGIPIPTSYPTNIPTKTPTILPTVTTKTPTINPTQHPTQSPIQATMASPTRINGSWSDTPPYGWRFTNVSGNVDPDIVTQSPSTQFWFHGPYKGIINSPQYMYISRQFYCAYNSILTIRYYVLYCNTEDFDYVELFFNNVSQRKTTLERPGTGTSINDATLTAYCSATPWLFYGPLTANIATSVLKNEIFNISYTFRLTAVTEATSVSYILITCKPITVSPTTNPSMAPTTAIPTTFEPTNIPSVTPTITPTNMPSILPTISPTATTFNPTTYEPTFNPTTATPTTTMPTTATPTTAVPTTLEPTTSMPTTFMPTAYPTTNIPTNIPTVHPTSKYPTTKNPTEIIIGVTDSVTKSTGDNEGEIPGDKTTDVLFTDTDSDDKDKNDNLLFIGKTNNFVYYIIGIILIVCCFCLLCFFYFKQRRKKRLKEAAAINTFAISRIQSNTYDKQGTCNTNINVKNTNDHIEVPATSPVSSAMNMNEIGTISQGQFGSNLNSLVVMDDIINVMQTPMSFESVNNVNTANIEMMNMNTHVTPNGYDIDLNEDHTIDDITNEDDEEDLNGFMINTHVTPNGMDDEKHNNGLKYIGGEEDPKLIKVASVSYVDSYDNQQSALMHRNSDYNILNDTGITIGNNDTETGTDEDYAQTYGNNDTETGTDGNDNDELNPNVRDDEFIISDDNYNTNEGNILSLNDKIWNEYYNIYGNEPNDIDQLQAFTKQSGQFKTLSFKEATIIFEERKGKGLIAVKETFND